MLPSASNDVHSTKCTKYIQWCCAIRFRKARTLAPGLMRSPKSYLHYYFGLVHPAWRYAWSCPFRSIPVTVTMQELREVDLVYILLSTDAFLDAVCKEHVHVHVCISDARKAMTSHFVTSESAFTPSRPKYQRNGEHHQSTVAYKYSCAAEKARDPSYQLFGRLCSNRQVVWQQFTTVPHH